MFHRMFHCMLHQICPWNLQSNALCSKPCGGGERFKHRSLVNKSNKSCKVKLTMSKKCNTKACPVNCVVSAWEVVHTCTHVYTHVQTHVYTHVY